MQLRYALLLIVVVEKQVQIRELVYNSSVIKSKTLKSCQVYRNLGLVYTKIFGEEISVENKLMRH